MKKSIGSVIVCLVACFMFLCVVSFQAEASSAICNDVSEEETELLKLRHTEPKDLKQYIERMRAWVRNVENGKPLLNCANNRKASKETWRLESASNSAMLLSKAEAEAAGIIKSLNAEAASVKAYREAKLKDIETRKNKAEDAATEIIKYLEEINKNKTDAEAKAATDIKALDDEAAGVETKAKAALQQIEERRKKAEPEDEKTMQSLDDEAAGVEAKAKAALQHIEERRQKAGETAASLWAREAILVALRQEAEEIIRSSYDESAKVQSDTEAKLKGIEDRKQKAQARVRDLSEAVAKLGVEEEVLDELRHNAEEDIRSLEAESVDVKAKAQTALQKIEDSKQKAGADIEVLEAEAGRVKNRAEAELKSIEERKKKPMAEIKELSVRSASLEAGNIKENVLTPDLRKKVGKRIREKLSDRVKKKRREALRDGWAALYDLEEAMRYQYRVLWEEGKDKSVLTAENGKLTKLNENFKYINNTVDISKRANGLTYADYNVQYSSFNLGYEFGGFSNGLDSSSVRIGIMTGRRAGIYKLPDNFNSKALFEQDNEGNNEWTWEWFKHKIRPYWIEAGVSLFITGVNEQTANIYNTAGIEMSEGDKQIALEGSLFLPIHRSALSVDYSPRVYSGLVFVIQQTFFDFKEEPNDSTVKKSLTKKYFGYRYAMGPEWFSEIGYGESDPLSSKRIVIRTQRPVPKSAADFPLFVGAEANIGIHRTKHKEEDQDVFKVFVYWNVPFDDAYKSFAGVK